MVLGFSPQNLGGGRDIWIILCHSMNAGPVVEIPWGSRDTQTLPYTKEFVWTGSGYAETLGVSACAKVQVLTPLPPGRISTI